jgi:uncharacterized protein YcbK (DUF882 family)
LIGFGMRWLAVAVLLGIGLGPATAAAKPPAKPTASAAKKSKAKPKTKRSKTKHARARVPAGYRAHVRRWHERAPDATAPTDASGRDKLVLEAINVGERVELTARSDDGSFDAIEQARAAHLLRDTRLDESGDLEPGLLDLLYRIQRHFDAPCIRVISGYRKAKSSRTSQHSRGHAADIVVPGVSDRELAAYVRSIPKTGVGLYPVSGFVHVDVRDRSHHWVDASGPGQRPRRVVHRQRRARAAKK